MLPKLRFLVSLLESKYNKISGPFYKLEPSLKSEKHSAAVLL